MDDGANDETGRGPVGTGKEKRHMAAVSQREICVQKVGDGVQWSGMHTWTCTNDHTSRVEGR
eukprot:6210665-Pleurochrysis_carterae.AAC.10